jgi:organic hydroperoxide reductase OsmC/OhrA
MSLHRASVEWGLDENEDFLAGRYSRAHGVDFPGGQHLAGTASTHVVGNRWAAPGAADPEEMLVAAISSCHMLTFLHEARKRGFVVSYYRDTAEGVMQRNAEGRVAITHVTLRPNIAYRGAAPDAGASQALHHAAHAECFIANSVKVEISVEEG